MIWCEGVNWIRLAWGTVREHCSGEYQIFGFDAM
jgi:hypothetical protein